MSNRHTDLIKKNLICLLLVLAVIAGSLVAVFTFLATAQFGETLGLAFFLAVSGLLIAGYMVGLMVLGLVIVPVAKYAGRPRHQRSITKPT